MVNESPQFWALIPAAGIGRRMESCLPKQYLSILDKTVLEHTLQRFLSLSMISGVMVVVCENDIVWPKMTLYSHPKLLTCLGGKERALSVMNGLNALSSHAKPNDWVLVHDAARPCIRPSLILHLIERLKEHPVGGILGLPQQDTLKQIQSIYEHPQGGVEGIIDKTVDRAKVWSAQTPQMFRYALLRDALQSALITGKQITDEAQAIELRGLFSLLVEGSWENIKLTYPDQLQLARFILQMQDNIA